MARAATDGAAWRRWASSAIDRARAAPAGAKLAVSIAVLVNLALLAGYCWSSGGQTTRIRLEVLDEHASVRLDGRLALEADFDDPRTDGGLSLGLSDTTNIPSLPRPRGLDSVRVTDLDTGEVVFEDDFSSIDPDVWTVAGQVFVEDGVVGVEQATGTLSLLGREWRNIAVDLTYRNVQTASVKVRSGEGNTGIEYVVRPYQHYDSGLVSRVQGSEPVSKSQNRVTFPRVEVTKSLVAMTLRPYPYVLAFLGAAFIAVLVLQFVPLPARARDRAWRAPPALAWAPIVVIAAAAFGVALFLNWEYGARIPHVPDEISYIFEAKLIASGRLWVDLPPVQDSFDFFYPPMIAANDGRWASVHPFGHALMLAPGIRVGLMWLVPPLVGAGCVLLVYGLCRRVYDNARVALLAALLLAASPFFLMHASTFMSHNTAAFYLLGALFFIAIRERRPLLYGAIAGLLFGLLFNTRPLSAAAIIPPIGVLFLSSLFTPDGRRAGVLSMGGFAAGGLVMLGAYLGYNFATTGDALENGYQASGQGDVGWGGGHTVEEGIQHEQTQMAYLLLVLNDWPQFVGLAFVLLPFIAGTRRGWDWFFLACAISMIGIHTAYQFSGIMHGPRFWYESTPLLMILAARGAERGAEILSGAAQSVRESLRGRSRTPAGSGTAQPMWAGVLVTYAVVLGLVGFGTHRWLLGDGGNWNGIDGVPEKASGLRGFNGANDTLLNAIDDADIEEPALVVVDFCPNWQCYGSVFLRNSPTFDSDVVYARNLPQRRVELFEAFPDRRVYAANYYSGRIAPYGQSVASGETPVSDATPPLAGSIPTPTPAPTATPDVAAVARRDSQRKEDLAEIAGLLVEYYRLHQGFPTVPNLQSLCTYNTDEGCKLKELRDPLPGDPSQGASYTYQSDGITFFILYAVLEADAEPSECPVEAPAHLAAVANKLYCVVGPDRSDE